MKTTYMCKKNYAVGVKTILPGSDRCPASTFQMLRVLEVCGAQIPSIHLTTHPHRDIIDFTYISCGGADAPKHNRGPKNEQPARARNTQPASSVRNGTAVRFQRVLRSTGSGASKIRDVTLRSERWALGYRGGQGVRIFTPFLLPGEGSLRRWWVGRPGTSAARAQDIPQADRRCHGLRTRVEATRPLDASD